MAQQSRVNFNDCWETEKERLGSNIQFPNKLLEEQYVLACARSGVLKIQRVCKPSAMVFGFFTIFILLNNPIGNTGTYIGFGSNALLTLLVAFCYYVTKQEWFLRSDNAERVMSCVVYLGAALLMFGQNATTYDIGLDRPGEELSFAMILCTAPIVYAMAISTLEILRFAVVKRLMLVMIVTHMIRSLWLVDLPSEMIFLWILFNYITIPALVFVSLQNTEYKKREVFYFHFMLENENRALAKRLNAAEQALAFEKPTDAEEQVVKEVFGGEGVVALKKYEIRFEDLVFHERIGAGAFAEVIRTEYLGTRCAVKRLLRTRVDKATVRMLHQEVTLISSLRHPNIVQFIGVSWDSIANLCVVFELVERGSMGDVLADTDLDISWEDPILRMVTDVAHGMAYLHRQNPAVIHRDLKPDNVLVTTTFSCKVTDFGASKEFKDAEEAQMTMVGTPSFMAPEIVTGKQYTEKVDVYAFALLIWAAYERKRPFHDMSLTSNQILSKTASEGLRPVVPPNMPPEISKLMQACWREEPLSRPSMRQVLKTLSSQSFVRGGSFSLSRTRSNSRQNTGTTFGESGTFDIHQSRNGSLVAGVSPPHVLSQSVEGDNLSSSIVSPPSAVVGVSRVGSGGTSPVPPNSTRGSLSLVRRSMFEGVVSVVDEEGEEGSGRVSSKRVASLVDVSSMSRPLGFGRAGEEGKAKGAVVGGVGEGGQCVEGTGSVDQCSSEQAQSDQSAEQRTKELMNGGVDNDGECGSSSGAAAGSTGGGGGPEREITMLAGEKDEETTIVVPPGARGDDSSSS